MIHSVSLKKIKKKKQTIKYKFLFLETLKRRQIFSNRKVIRLSEVFSILDLSENQNNVSSSNQLQKQEIKSINLNSFATSTLTNVTKDSYYQQTINVNNKITSPTASVTNTLIITNESINKQNNEINSVNSNSTTEFFSNFNDTNLSIFKNQQPIIIPDTNPENDILDKYTQVNVYSKYP